MSLIFLGPSGFFLDLLSLICSWILCLWHFDFSWTLCLCFFFLGPYVSDILIFSRFCFWCLVLYSLTTSSSSVVASHHFLVRVLSFDNARAFFEKSLLWRSSLWDRFGRFEIAWTLFEIVFEIMLKSLWNRICNRLEIALEDANSMFFKFDRQNFGILKFCTCCGQEKTRFS